MLATPAEPCDWSELVRDTLASYAEPLLFRVSSKLVKPKIGQDVEGLAEKAAETQTNPPVIDRRLREIGDTPRELLRLIALSRQPRWAIGHLLDLAAATGSTEGFGTVRELLEAGLMFPHLRFPIAEFDEWFGRVGLRATAFVHPAVLTRVRGGSASGAAEPPASDGLDWPIRLAGVWQLVRATSVRVTQANSLFKRDLARLQADPVLTAPSSSAADVPEAGALAFAWATAAGLLANADGDHTAAAFPPVWGRAIGPLLADLFAAFFSVDVWDPLAGYRLTEGRPSPAPTAALLALTRLTDDWQPCGDVAHWLWEHHASWPATLPKDAQKKYGTPWVESLFLGVLAPLGIVEAKEADGWQFRRTTFGRYLLANGPEPSAPPAFPQTILVQPNAELLVYRQGLTPTLIASLSRFARWKQLGAACTLELTAEETYRGLESGLTLPAITQSLDRHGMRPVPPAVTDLLRRWADKRERITLYSSATLVEFANAADLESALARGIVAVKLTDRVGLTADGTDPDFSSLRLIGNRDYDARPERCVSVAADGLTLTVDAAASDLLLEAEIGRLADPVTSENAAFRKHKLSPESLRRAVNMGMDLEDLDGWFQARSGLPLSHAGRLFVQGPTMPMPMASRIVVLELPTEAAAEGIMQWPTSAAYIERRLGATAVVVDAANLDPLRAVLATLGIQTEVLDSWSGRVVS